jgi:cell division protein FtsL
VLALVAAVVTSAVAAVESRHRARLAFIELQGLAAERDRLQTEWGQLQIEQGALATHGRIEHIARDRLDMRPPEPREIEMVAVER